MAKVFDYDNKVFRFMGKMVDAFFVSALFLLFSIPVVTIGASTQALYYTVHKQIKGGRGYVWQEFYSSFKDHLKTNVVLSLIFEVLVSVFAYERILLRTMLDNGAEDSMRVMYFVVIFFQMLVVIWAVYTFCYRARFVMDGKNSMKNGLLLMIGYLPTTLLLLVSLGVAVLIVYFVPILVFFVPALLFLFYDFLLEKIFHKIMRPEDLEQEESLEMERKRDDE